MQAANPTTEATKGMEQNQSFTQPSITQSHPLVQMLLGLLHLPPLYRCCPLYFPLLMKLVFKWLRYIMNKFVIYSQMNLPRRYILYLSNVHFHLFFWLRYFKLAVCLKGACLLLLCTLILLFALKMSWNWCMLG